MTHDQDEDEDEDEDEPHNEEEQATEFSPSVQIVEAASWRVAAELLRRHAPLLRLVETHPGGGKYDCLCLFRRGDAVDTQWSIQLNRAGTVHILGDEHASWPNFWPALLSVHDPKLMIDGIEILAGLSNAGPQNNHRPEVLVTRTIATFLTHAILGRTSWECRSGYHDSSGPFSGPQDTWFAQFPEADQRRHDRQPDDFLGLAEYRFWFLLRNHEPVRCLDTTGTVWSPGARGFRWDLPTLAKRTPRIWPLVEIVAGPLLP